MALGQSVIDTFVADGYARIERAFSRGVADAVVARLWADMGRDPDRPETWTDPVVRLGMYTDPRFVEAANTPRLRDAFDALVGPGRYRPVAAMGTFRCAFPSAADPGDCGWHVDASLDFDRPDFLSWRVNVASDGRALLLLFLFTDVGPDDGPTRIRVGSHRTMARVLAPHGAHGMTLRDLVAVDFGGDPGRGEVEAVGAAGTVYLCHPFLVHSAQPNRTGRPRFLAQPPLLPVEGHGPAAGAPSAVEAAIRAALDDDA